MGVTTIGKLRSGHVLVEHNGVIYKVNVPVKLAEKAELQDKAAYFKPGMFVQSDPEENKEAEAIVITDREKTQKSFTIFKTDDDQHLVFGWASVSITVDGQILEDRQHDTIDPEDLEEAAYEYVLNFRDTGEEHMPGYRKKGKLVESCVFTAEKQKAMGIPEGVLPVAWWIGFKIDDEDTWQLVKNGTYKMFSIEGRAQREEIQKAESTARSFEEVLKFNPYHGYHGYFSTAEGATSMTARTKYGPGQKAIANIKGKATGEGSNKYPMGNTWQKNHKSEDGIGTYLSNEDYPRWPDDTTYLKVAKDLQISEEKAKAMAESIYSYASSAYEAIRAGSRGEDNNFKIEAENCEEFIKASPKWAGGKIYRGIEIYDEADMYAILDKAGKGQPIDMRGISSWTSEQSVAEKFAKGLYPIVFITNGTSTKNGTSIKHLARYEDEDEVLVSKDAVFTPTKIEKAYGMIYIYGDMP